MLGLLALICGLGSCRSWDERWRSRGHPACRPTLPRPTLPTVLPYPNPPTFCLCLTPWRPYPMIVHEGQARETCQRSFTANADMTPSALDSPSRSPVTLSHAHALSSQSGEGLASKPLPPKSPTAPVTPVAAKIPRNAKHCLQSRLRFARLSLVQQLYRHTFHVA